MDKYYNKIDPFPTIKDGEICDPILWYCDSDSYDIKTRNIYVSNFRMLLNKLINLITYSNCPIPNFELQLRLILQGFAPIFKSQEYGLVTGWGSLYGISIYNRFTNWLVTQPVLGTYEGTIDKDAVIIYNTELDKQGGSVVLNRLKYYAKQLTDLQVSLDVYTINSRATTAVVTRDDTTRNALNEFYGKIKNGDYTFPLAANGVLPTHAPLLATDREYFKPLEIMECIDKLIIQFSEEFGVEKRDVKKERMIVDEVQSDTNYLLWNVSSMLRSQYEGICKVNKLFNTNWEMAFVGERL